MERPEWHFAERDDARLWCADFDGDGPPVVLLYGLAGYAGEWTDTATWLSRSHRVVVVEQRGHGRSERIPRDVSRLAFVADVEMWVERLGLEPAIVVGQSLGGHTAFLLAAKRPDLVRGLVVVEATPRMDPDAPGIVRAWLETWPTPFASSNDAIRFFGDTTWGRTWAGGLESRDDGLWPSFDRDTMLACLDEIAHRSYWDDWRRVVCPTLVVRGERGMTVADAQRMVALVPSARMVEVPGAGHDLHLEQPSRWRRVLDAFLPGL